MKMKFLKLLIFVFSTCILSLFLITSAGATIYYVDASMPDDSGNGLSEKTAWKTIGKVNSVNFANNDTIKFKRGEVWTDATLTLNGTPAGRSGISIQDYGTGNKPLFDGNFIQPIYIDHALVNLTIKNIDISGWNEVSWQRATFKRIKGITIDGVDFDGHVGANTFAGIPTVKYLCVEPYPGAAWVGIVLDIAKNDSGDITIKNCTIVNLLKSAGFAASITAWCKNDLKAIRIYQAEEYRDGGKISGVVYIHDNTITNIYSDMIQMNAIQVVQHIYNNTCIGFGENFIDVKSSRYGKIYNNELSGGNIGKDPGVGYFGPSMTVFHEIKGGAPVGAYEIYGNYIHDTYGEGLYLNGNYHKVYNNYIKDCLLGIRIAQGSGYEIYNNIIETTSSVLQDPDSHYSGVFRSAILFTTEHISKVYNNTIYVNNSNASNGITIQNNSSGSEYKNNIIYTTNAGDYPLHWNGTGSTPTLSNNLYYNPETINRAYWNGATKTTANITDIDANAISGNPGLQNIANGQLFPISTSSVVNAGTVLKISTLGLLQDSIWPNNVLIIPRQDQGGYDIGAYEYAESVKPSPPSSPQKLEIQN
jgi:hypothetical protein